ncbi:hypothetical protein [Microseira wollei]|uniref:Uncharacterized protein n=1 Tax=Microseira wollei NIES-4236 TaxID=2530354 RepID=A0AAV3XF32_9CYAN|nr:hypothetical protein [Microseira wollei]GET41183.1 hypothetical protein MiSe_59950 [Microseira wollei NIES-4236]
MKPNLLILMATTLTIVTLSNGGLAQRQSAPPSNSTRQPLAQIVETRGRVELKRESNYQTARVGDNLYIGNLVRVPKGSRLVIRCTANSRTWTIPDDNLPRGVANFCSPPM